MVHICIVKHQAYHSCVRPKFFQKSPLEPPCLICSFTIAIDGWPRTSLAIVAGMPGSSTSFTQFLRAKLLLPKTTWAVCPFWKKTLCVNQYESLFAPLLFLHILSIINNNQQHTTPRNINSKNEEMRCWIIVFNETHFGLLELLWILKICKYSVV